MKKISNQILNQPKRTESLVESCLEARLRSRERGERLSRKEGTNLQYHISRIWSRLCARTLGTVGIRVEKGRGERGGEGEKRHTARVSQNEFTVNVKGRKEEKQRWEEIELID